MLQNSRVTPFTVFELLKENQLGGKGKINHPPPTHIRVQYYEGFAAAVMKAFGSYNVVQRACCRGFHADGGERFHMSIELKSSRLWGPVKEKVYAGYNVSLNFKTESYRYVAA